MKEKIIGRKNLEINCIDYDNKY